MDVCEVSFWDPRGLLESCLVLGSWEKLIPSPHDSGSHTNLGEGNL